MPYDPFWTQWEKTHTLRFIDNYNEKIRNWFWSNQNQLKENGIHLVKK
jgi:hypothetical protein